MTEKSLDERIAEKPFPKVTLDGIKDRITSVVYIRPTNSPTSTLASVTVNNGYTVVGVSGCADPRNFDAKIGEELALKDAIRQLWPLFGFALAERLSIGEM